MAMYGRLLIDDLKKSKMEVSKMPNTPEGQKGMKDLTEEDRKVARDVLEAENAAGIPHPSLNEKDGE